MLRVSQQISCNSQGSLFFDFNAGIGRDARGIQGLSGIKVSDQRLEEMSKARRPGKRASSAERWELAAMKAAGVLKPQDHPDFDEDGNVSSSSLLIWGLQNLE